MVAVSFFNLILDEEIKMRKKSLVLVFSLAVVFLMAVSGVALAETAGDKVNINTATVAELAELDGIGSAYAQRIVDYRTAHGLFTSIDQIKDVKGIGEKTFEKNKERLTVGEPVK